MKKKFNSERKIIASMSVKFPKTHLQNNDRTIGSVKVFLTYIF